MKEKKKENIQGKIGKRDLSYNHNHGGEIIETDRHIL